MPLQLSAATNNKTLFTLGIFGFVAAFFIVYASTFISISNVWLNFSNAYGHGFIILATAVYIIYEDRNKFLASISCPSYLFLLPNLVLSGLWFIGYFLGIQILQQAILPALILSSCGALFGRKLFGQLLFIVALVYLSIPVWDYLTEPLQAIATFVVGKAVFFIGIPIHISGYTVEIPSGSFEIAGGCAGLRYLTVGMMISLLYGYWNCRSTKDKVYLFLIGICMSLLSNWLRIFVIIIVGHLTNMQSSLIANHDNFGWLLFAAMLIIYFIIGNVLFANKRSNTDVSHHKKTLTIPQLCQTEPNYTILCILFVTTFFIPLAGNYSASKSPTTSSMKFVQLDTIDWKNVPVKNDIEHPSWQPLFFGASTKQHFTFINARTHTINLFLYSYHHENQKDGELINYNNTIADKNIWAISQRQPIDIEFDHEAIKANVSIITHRNSGKKNLVFFWYSVGDEFTSSGFKAKLLKLKSLIAQPTSPPTLLAYSINCTTKCDNALIILQSVIQDTVIQR